MARRITVLTNGVFDVIHRGHIELLQYCKSRGNNLVVAIDTDRRVKELKGDNRPVNSQEDRLMILRSIRYVDEVILFDSAEELRNLYREVDPDILVKGKEERTVEELRENDGIPDYITIELCPFVNGYSTTETMRKIKSMSSCEKST